MVVDNVRDIPIAADEEMNFESLKAATQLDAPDVMVQVSYPVVAELKKLVLKSVSISIFAMIASIGFGSVATVIGIANLSKANPLAIARSNGETETLEYFAGNARSDELIKSFAARQVRALNTWRTLLPDGKVDPGEEVESGKKIPTAVFQATLSMEPRFAAAFRKVLAGTISAETQANKDMQGIFIMGPMGAVRKTGDRLWTVPVTGYQLITGGGAPVTKQIKWELTMMAVPPSYPKADDKKYDPVTSKATQLSNARAEGLEIKNISITK